MPNSSLAWAVFICMSTAPSVELSAPNDDVPDSVQIDTAAGHHELVGVADDEAVLGGGIDVHRELARPAGGAPSTSVNGLSCALSIQLNASCGGPLVGMLSPFGLIGRTALSADSMLATASATPSTAATVDTVLGGKRWGVTEVGDVADLEIDAGGDVFGHVGEAAAQAVAEHEGRDDEADGEDHAEGGEGEANLVRQKVLDGESKHGRCPIVSVGR